MDENLDKLRAPASWQLMLKQYLDYARRKGVGTDPSLASQIDKTLPLDILGPYRI